MLSEFCYFLIFLLVFVLLFYAINNKHSHHILFIASLAFLIYLSLKVAIFSLAFTTLNYFLGRLIEKYKNKKALKTKLFWTSITLDIVFLAFFKFTDFLFDNINTILSLTTFETRLPYLNLILPIGISYYTFQALGYIIRINRGTEKAEKNFVKFATLLLFFPKLLSGPVERSTHFFPQLNNASTFKSENITAGLQRLIWGSFKVFVVANNLYSPIGTVYSNIYDYSGISIILVFLTQGIYIYFNFSGYTDMALGASKIFGINLIENFKRPFMATSISEFWKRWHISLSSWCNDFIFIPFIVKYRKWGNKAAVIGLFVTFLIIGIWHGANWTFVILGILQGIALIYEFYTKKIRISIANKLPKGFSNAISRVFVYLFIAVTMVFFFSHSLKEAAYFLTQLFVIENYELSSSIFTNKYLFILALFFFIIIFIPEMLVENGKLKLSLFIKQSPIIRWAAIVIMALLIVFVGSDAETFYYMRF